MGQESIVIISGHQYRYEYDEETQTTKYLGPVGDAPEMTEEIFLAAMNIPKRIKFTKNQEELFKVVANRAQHPFSRYALIETGGQYNMLTVRSLRDKGLVEVSELRGEGPAWDEDNHKIMTGPLVGEDVFYLRLTEKGEQYAKAHGYWDW